jgi:hypothetical protein
MPRKSFENELGDSDFRLIQQDCKIELQNKKPPPARTLIEILIMTKINYAEGWLLMMPQ